MSGSIALAGGDEFRSGCRGMDTALLELSGSDSPSVLVIPTAAAAEGRPDLAAANGVSYFKSLGARALPLMVVNAEEANVPELAVALEGFSHVYFSGGSPEFLLGVLKGSLLLEQVLEWRGEGGILAGSSAGAMVMGEYMRSPRSGRWVEGLGVCPGVGVLPHHEERDPGEVSASLEGTLPEGVNVLGIDAQSGCLFSDGGWEVLGEGNVTLYREGRWSRYGPGERFFTESPNGAAGGLLKG